MWLSSIYVQIDNPDLESHLVSLANELECELLTGDTSDLIAIPCFATIVDRSIVGKKWWQEYLDYRILSNDKTPCIVINDTSIPDDIELKKIYYTNDAGLVGEIISREKRHLNSFEWYYANPHIQRIKEEIATFWADFI